MSALCRLVSCSVCLLYTMHAGELVAEDVVFLCCLTKQQLTSFECTELVNESVGSQNSSFNNHLKV